MVEFKKEYWIIGVFYSLLHYNCIDNKPQICNKWNSRIFCFSKNFFYEWAILTALVHNKSEKYKMVKFFNTLTFLCLQQLCSLHKTIVVIQTFIILFLNYLLKIFHKVLNIFMMYPTWKLTGEFTISFQRFFYISAKKTYQMKTSINNYKTKLENTWRFIKAFNVRNQF